MTNSTTTPPTVLIAGASGDLGGRIARELAALGIAPRHLLRGGSAHRNADSLVESTDGKIVDGDVTEPDSLAAAVEGVDVIISTLQGGPDIIIDGQAALAAAGKAAGARRIFASDFSVDFTDIAADDHLFLAWRAQGQQAIAATGLAQTNTYNGAFMRMLLPQEMLTFIDWDAHTVRHGGSPDQRYDFTTMDDVARYVAAAAIDDTPPDGAFRIAGDQLSPNHLAAAATRRRGQTFTMHQEGTLDDLDRELAPASGRSARRPDAMGRPPVRSRDGVRGRSVAVTRQRHISADPPDQRRLVPRCPRRPGPACVTVT